jgi:queuine/archaeosine tRNA-ribosyltransferase
MHNLYYYQKLMKDLRGAISAGTVAEFTAALRRRYAEAS